jgi:hypothetical protein
MHKLIPLLMSGWSLSNDAGNQSGFACSPGGGFWRRPASRFLSALTLVCVIRQRTPSSGENFLIFGLYVPYLSLFMFRPNLLSLVAEADYYDDA